MCGLELDPWQQLCCHEATKERPDGRWSSFEVGLCVARQNGKGSFLEALELAGIILFGERLIIHSAHEFKTAVNAMDRLVTLLKGSGLKFNAKKSHGAESIEILDGPNPGAKVMFQTRTKGSGLGLTADRIILDEAMMITPESYQALMPTLSSTPNPQIILTGSAVDQRIHPHCETFGSLRHRAMEIWKSGAKNPGICYLEWSGPDDLDPREFGERRYWAMSNPGLGYRQTEEKISNEYQAFKSNLRAFGVQRLSIGDWPAFGDARSEIPRDRWERLVDLEPVFTGKPVVTLYRAPEGGEWTIAAAWRTSEYDKESETTIDRIHLEVGYVGEDPADTVVGYFLDTVANWDTQAVIVGRGAASDVLPELRAAGVEPVVPNLGEEAQGCGGLLNDIFAQGLPLISHGNHSGLNNATANAIKRDLPSGGFVWDDEVDRAAYSQLMAVTLARWGVIAHGEPVGDPTIYDWPDQDEIDEWLDEDVDAWLNSEED